MGTTKPAWAKTTYPWPTLDTCSSLWFLANRKIQRRGGQTVYMESVFDSQLTYHGNMHMLHYSKNARGRKQVYGSELPVLGRHCHGKRAKLLWFGSKYILNCITFKQNNGPTNCTIGVSGVEPCGRELMLFVYEPMDQKRYSLINSTSQEPLLG